MEQKIFFFVNVACFARKHFLAHPKLVGTPCTYYQVAQQVLDRLRQTAKPHFFNFIPLPDLANSRIRKKKRKSLFAFKKSEKKICHIVLWFNKLFSNRKILCESSADLISIWQIFFRRKIQNSNCLDIL